MEGTKLGLHSPAARLVVASLVAIGVLALVFAHAVKQPWLGLRLRWDESAGGARVLASEGPAAAIPEGTVIAALRGADDASPLALEPVDFTIEPDSDLPSYRTYAHFLARQEQLSRIQAAPRVTLIEPGGRTHELLPLSSRPFTDLPTDYWVQVIVGLLAWLISASVWAFRPHERSARYLLLSGLSTLIFAPFAAVYTTRELAMPAQAFVWLSDLNHFGGIVYGATMLALLWYYPRQLGAAIVGPLIELAFIAWYAAQELGAFDSMIVGRRIPVFVALPATFVLSAVQWRATRNDPVARASLSWFLMSWLLGTSLFVCLTMVPQLFGIRTAALQGYGFLLFLLVYGGLAFGIVRFRLFELGEWWARMFTWIAGAVLLFALDFLLALAFALPAATSLGVALLICGFLWLPLRGLIWSRFVGGSRRAEPDLFKAVVQVAFSSSRAQRKERWCELLARLCDPLRSEELEDDPGEVRLEGDGLQLLVPRVGPSAGLKLAYAGKGRRLFSPHDVRRVSQLVEMLRYVDESREAYNQGAREERGRIARDLHDDIGSRLLTGLHQHELLPAKEAISQALTDMRTIIHGLSGNELTLENMLAELRHETSLRLEAAGVALEWPLLDAGDETRLSYGVYKHYLSIMRELISNVIRHARASAVTVRVRWEGARLVSEVQDDGTGFDERHVAAGHGIGNLRRRLRDLGGGLHYVPVPQGTLARVEVPLEQASADAASRQRGTSEAAARVGSLEGRP